MPTPEQLGIPMPKAPPSASRERERPESVAVDWTALRARLDRLGVTAFTLEKAANGYRFTCHRAAGRLVEGRGATEAEAIRLALEQTERR